MTTLNREISSGQLVPLVFMQSDSAASQTNVALTVAEVRDVAALVDDQNAADSYVLPWDFEVVGVSVRASAARTAGTLTVEPTIGGTAIGATAVLDATNTQSHHTRNLREADRGVAGGRVGCNITTTAAWAPVAADVAVVVWVLLNLEGI